MRAPFRQELLGTPRKPRAGRWVLRFRLGGVFSLGEVLVPLACDDAPFNRDELYVIDDVARFVNTFSSATGLSDYSHHLSCWVDSSDGEIIEFTRGACEVSQAIRDRMESAQS